MIRDGIVLRNLKESDREEFYHALSADWQGFDFLHYWDTLGKRDFATYRNILEGIPQGKYIPKDHVPATFLFAFNQQNQLVGRCSVRHELDSFLLQIGGHIGYAVLPQFRRRGYATAILKASLEYIQAHLPQISRALVTCDNENIASIKTIEANGGVFENTYIHLGNQTRRYWISL